MKGSELALFIDDDDLHIIYEEEFNEVEYPDLDVSAVKEGSIIILARKGVTATKFTPYAAYVVEQYDTGSNIAMLFNLITEKTESALLTAAYGIVLATKYCSPIGAVKNIEERANKNYTQWKAGNLWIDRNGLIYKALESTQYEPLNGYIPKVGEFVVCQTMYNTLRCKIGARVYKVLELNEDSSSAIVVDIRSGIQSVLEFEICREDCFVYVPSKPDQNLLNILADDSNRL